MFYKPLTDEYVFGGVDSLSPSAINQGIALSEEKKCAIHTSFSSNDAWLYGWSASCDLT